MHFTFKETRKRYMRRKECQNMYLHILHNALEIKVQFEAKHSEMGVGCRNYIIWKRVMSDSSFSDIIHHYHAFSEKTSRADYGLGSVFFAGSI